MTTIKASFSITDSTSIIKDKILTALLIDAQNFFDNIYNKISESIPEIIINHIIDQPEYDALISGTLQYEFGLPDPSARLQEIIETIRNGSFVKYKPVSIKSSKLVGEITIEMIKKDFSDLLSLGSSTLITEKGDRLNWLQWLLLEGDSVIVSDYFFVLGPNNNSRTGFGIMKQFGGGFWRVPPEYAGSINNNWITRAINSAIGDIDTEINKLFK